MVRMNYLFLTLGIAPFVQGVNHGKAQVEWIREKGGYFNPKLSIEIGDPEKPPAAGIFATKDIPQGELLFSVPPDCFITPEEESQDLCDTARTLLNEAERKDESEFSPYVDYLLSGVHRRRLASSWSEEGLDLLDAIVGKEIPGFDLWQYSFEKHCGGSGDRMEEDVFQLAVSYHWEHTLIPLYDMIDVPRGRRSNVETSDKEGKFAAIASRSIVSGERLQYAWSANPFIWQRSIRDYGYASLYPSHWLFFSDPDVEYLLDAKADTGTNDTSLYEVTWLTDKPNYYALQYLRGHLKRLQDLGEHIYERADQLESNHEREATIAFYQAIVTALDQAIWSGMSTDDNEEEGCAMSTFAGDLSACPASPRKYDRLDELPDPLTYDMVICEIHEDTENEKFLQVESFYQKIDFGYSDSVGDVCLYLNDWIQACSSTRPHYHEYFVHIPARFLPEVKRVVVIGGGDLMILHEILKYPSLELVVVMELDQQVVRSSFHTFGTQPHWDNDVIEWWFGDATKTLHMLPKEYFGTFDLVLIDLMTEVAELKVSEDLTIVDAVTMLAKPDAVIAKNEDYIGMHGGFADYTVDLQFSDIPNWCSQSITLGSNTDDFLSQELVDHKIKTLHLQPIDKILDHFDGWYHYTRNATRVNKSCRQPGEVEKELVEQTSSQGVLMILEAENATLLVELPNSVQSEITRALKKVDLTLVSFKMAFSNEEGHGDTMVFVLKEGYVVARTWPLYQYCAFDLHLWSSFDKMKPLQQELVAAVGGQLGGNSSSSYRLTSGGMFGVSTWKEDEANIGPHKTQLCESRDEPVRNVPVEHTATIAALNEGMSLIQRENSLVIVMCGEHSRPCASLEELTKDGAKHKAVPLWTCPNVAAHTERIGDAPDDMIICEGNSLRELQAFVETDGKIAGIVVDQEVPREMGQVLHKIFSDTKFRRELAAEDIVVLAITPTESESWRRVLLERFRTDFFWFDPAYKADVFFNSTTSTMEMGIFSSGNANFFSNVTDVISRIEKQTGLDADLRTVKNGILNYVADFEPEHSFTIDSYNNSSPLKQWLSQQSVSRQTIIQYELQSPEVPLSTQLVRKAFQNAVGLANSNDRSVNEEVYKDLGDGCLVLSFSSTGNVVAVWDGRKRITVNLFTFSEDREVHILFEKLFAETIPSLNVTGRDEQPRGFGRVVNFEKDRNGTPLWVTQALLANAEKDQISFKG